MSDPRDNLGNRNKRDTRGTHANAESQNYLAQFLKLHPKYIDLSLERMWQLLARLGHPEKNLPPIIHIAGTNGKGSTLAYLKAILMASGKSVHAYTSPHLTRFHERINLNGKDISEPALTALLAEVQLKNEGHPITFFEATTATALCAFARMQADYLLLEVGLGGKFDATNVIDNPRLSLITPISLDHEHFLGTTLAEIAGEKAGILKSGCPALIAHQDGGAMAVIQAQAEKIGTPYKVSHKDWRFTKTSDGEGMMLHYNAQNNAQNNAQTLTLPAPSLSGAHQYENAALATMAALELGVDGAKAIRQGLTQTIWPARLQKIPPLPNMAPREDLWLDGGHNPAAAKALASWATTWQKDNPNTPFHIICAMLNTKQAETYFAAFKKLTVHLHTLTIPDEKNSLTASQLLDAGTRAGLKATAHDDLAQAIKMTPPKSRILICGSLYMAGRVLARY